MVFDCLRLLNPNDNFIVGLRKFDRVTEQVDNDSLGPTHVSKDVRVLKLCIHDNLDRMHLGVVPERLDDRLNNVLNEINLLILGLKSVLVEKVHIKVLFNCVKQHKGRVLNDLQVIERTPVLFTSLELLFLQGLDKGDHALDGP